MEEIARQFDAVIRYASDPNQLVSGVRHAIEEAHSDPSMLVDYLQDSGHPLHRVAAAFDPTLSEFDIPDYIDRDNVQGVRIPSTVSISGSVPAYQLSYYLPHGGGPYHVVADLHPNYDDSENPNYHKYIRLHAKLSPQDLFDTLGDIGTELSDHRQGRSYPMRQRSRMLARHGNSLYPPASET